MATAIIRTEDELYEMTNDALREVCKTYGINTGISKANKRTLADLILAAQEEKRDEERKAAVDKAAEEAAKKASQPVKVVKSTVVSKRTDSGVVSRIRVTCGASSGEFEVVGRPAGEVAQLLQDALNIPTDPTIIVNGQVQQGTYVLQPYDEMEFLKPAGRKGL